MAAGLEINQLELPNYLASDTCPKPLQSSGCQSGRLGEIVVVTCYRSFLSLVVQKIYGVTICDTNDYKVFGKTAKHNKMRYACIPPSFHVVEVLPRTWNASHKS